MDSREFTEWQAYYRIEPFGDDWLQAGTVAAASMAANPFSNRKYHPEKFIPRAKATKSPEQIEREMMMFARMHNARMRN